MNTTTKSTSIGRKIYNFVKGVLVAIFLILGLGWAYQGYKIHEYSSMAPPDLVRLMLTEPSAMNRYFINQAYKQKKANHFARKAHRTVTQAQPKMSAEQLVEVLTNAMFVEAGGRKEVKPVTKAEQKYADQWLKCSSSNDYGSQACDLLFTKVEADDYDGISKSTITTDMTTLCTKLGETEINMACALAYNIGPDEEE